MTKWNGIVTVFKQRCITKLAIIPRPIWLPLLIVALMALCVKLGFWQYARALEKKAMVNCFEQMQSQAPIKWGAEKAAPHQYQRLILQGKLLPNVFLLDNQHYRHQFGYQVISPLQLDSGQVVLINRGWIAGDISRKNLPNLKAVSGYAKLQGSVYYPSKKTWSLGEFIDHRSGTTTVIESMDLEKIAVIEKWELEPFVLRLGQDQNLALTAFWPVIAMTPERHFGYMMQWFFFAVILAVGLVILIIKQRCCENA